MNASALWVDKYRPTTLNLLDYHDELTVKLGQMVFCTGFNLQAASGDFPHVLFYGPSGAGKKTRVTAVLRELFGAGAEKLKIENRQVVTSSNKKLDIHVISSNFHVEITPSDLGINDRVVIQDLIKELAQTKQLDLNSKQKFKIVVFNEADSLSRGAQAALRRTMEKYMGNLRLIMCCNVTSKIIGPIRSRCLMLRVPAPATQDMCRVMKIIAEGEKFTLPDSVALQIAEKAGGNMRRALLILEAAYVQQYPFPESLILPSPDWELFVNSIAERMFQEQSPACLQEIRTKLYALLANCIPPELILKNVAFEFLKIVDSKLKVTVIRTAAEYEHRMRLGSKPIFHLEALCAKLMSLYANFLIES